MLLRLHCHVFIEPGLDLFLAQISVMIDVACFKHLLNVLLGDFIGLATFRTCQSSLSDLESLSDEVESLQSFEDSGLTLVELIPDLIDDRIEQLLR